MPYEMKRFELTDICTGRVDIVRAKDIITLNKRLGKRADEVLIRQLKRGEIGSNV
jgi:hypothetical protein